MELSAFLNKNHVDICTDGGEAMVWKALPVP